MNVLLNNNKQIHTVSSLNKKIKSLIEDAYRMVWITGEISNFTRAASGHMYFSLKDNSSQISCVMFKNQTYNLKFDLERGLKIIGFGRINLYEPRGTYQIIFENIEPEGTGALHIAFEQLKKKLMSEGLFDEKFKKKIPFLPNRISVITSASGSVIHDIINVTSRRFSGMHIELAPVKVQGEGSEREIVSAIQMLNKRESTEVIILARGGGSLEDMTAFNSEPVARAIFNSKVPVISAVGHETDFTIADFTSDLRAPTPSAAAEIATQDKNELLNYFNETQITLTNSLKRLIKEKRNEITRLMTGIIDPRKKIQDLKMRNDELSIRLENNINKLVISKRENLKWKSEKLLFCSPELRIKEERKNIDFIQAKLKTLVKELTEAKKNKTNRLTQRLNDLNPMSILGRGYSITRTKDTDKKVISAIEAVSEKQELEVLVSNGTIDCKVQRITKNV